MAVGGRGSDGLVEGVGAFIVDGGAGGSPTPLSPEFDDVLALLRMKKLIIHAKEILIVIIPGTVATRQGAINDV